MEGWDEGRWAAVREAYVHGKQSMKALAQAHGLSCGAVRRRATAEGWTALRRAARGEGDRAEEDEAALARRVRRRLLLMLEEMADSLPRDATELKSQDGDGAKLMKLRDLTAAYKELVGDMPRGEDAGGEKRVIIDV